ncbi:MAG: hypothetical protein K2K90_04340, partial [Lachnospiraceae bacterium]|nr:hypothetical protein [Lachnospiraceae bacterium]
NGVTGQNGAAGQKGTDGQSGAAGQKSTDGQSGAAGQKGTDGQNDTDGQSAYGRGSRGIELLLEEMRDSPDTPLALWVEECAGKNIVQVLYMTGLDDYRITGYLVEVSACGKVYEIAADAVYRVRQERRTAF